MKYFLSIIGVAACFVLLCFAGEESGYIQMMRMGDSISLFALLLVVVTVLISVGLHKDFFCAFRIAYGKKGGRSLMEMKRAKEAVDLAIKAAAGAGILGFCVGVVESSYCDRLASIPINIGVSTISLLYAVIFSLLLIPIQSKLKMKIMEYMGE